MFNENVQYAANSSQSHKIHLAITDLYEGLKLWRIWWTLSLTEIKSKYGRSKIGQFWLTLSMAITISALGFIYAYLFKIPINDYLPFLTASFVFWNLINNLIMEGCNSFIAGEPYLRQIRIPTSVFVYRCIVRNLIVFGHNVILIIPAMLIFDKPFTWTILISVFGVLLILINSLWFTILFGMLCARFRDLPQIVASFMQIMFFVTPVLWRPNQLGEKFDFINHINPFAVFLDIVRAPLFGRIPDLATWSMAFFVTIVGFAVTIWFFVRFRSRIIYWL